jgi:hypothetical protein
MLKKLGLKTMALAAGLAVAAPTLSLARDRDDSRGRNFNSHARVENHAQYEHRDIDNRGFRDRDDRRFNFRSYSAPAPAANGYYDQYGVWHPNGYYDRFGVWHTYGY